MFLDTNRLGCLKIVLVLFKVSLSLGHQNNFHMNAKEKFLANIQQRIKVLQDAYEYNKNLPEDMFENLGNGIMQATPPDSGAKNNGSGIVETGYGAYKKSVKDIISSHRMGVLKKDIIKVFHKQYPNAGDTAVTTALVALQKEGDIRKEKPKGIKVKGFLWFPNN